MRCLDPRTRVAAGHDLIIPCGQCIRCRLYHRERWMGRLMLESLYNPGWFLTLTYKTPCLIYGCLPGKDPIPTLWKKDAQLFLKRLRKRLAPAKIRYFCVGEYGFEKDRPHYHFVLYGPHRDITADVAASWDRGFITCEPLTPSRARYTAGYTVQKLTSDSSFTDGRSPEYATMSRRPGLGHDAALKIGQLLMRSGGPGTAIPHVMKIGGKQIVLDRYMRSVIQRKLGYEEQRREISLFKAHEKAPATRIEFARRKAKNPHYVSQAAAQELEQFQARRRRRLTIPSPKVQSAQNTGTVSDKRIGAAEPGTRADPQHSPCDALPVALKR